MLIQGQDKGKLREKLQHSYPQLVYSAILPITSVVALLVASLTSFLSGR